MITNSQLQKFIKSSWVIILAAGKGSRMKAKEKNKVAYEIKGVPIVSRTINNIRDVGIQNVIMVVGFAKESVIKLLDERIYVAVQSKRLGTGHALKVGFEKVNDDAELVLVMNGDDSYGMNSTIISDLYRVHLETNADMTFLSIVVDNPFGLGRVKRNENGQVVKIVEEKDATEKERSISEINAACYLFSYDFLKKNINKIKKSKVTGEYYIVSLVDIAAKQGKTIETLKLEGVQWRGINTPEELKIAETLV